MFTIDSMPFDLQLRLLLSPLGSLRAFVCLHDLSRESRYRLGGYHGAGRLLLSDSKIAARSRDLLHPLPGPGLEMLEMGMGIPFGSGRDTISTMFP